MFSQVNGRIDALNERLDTIQTEMNRRFDRVDQHFDQVFEVLRVFEGGLRVSKKKPAWHWETPIKKAHPQLSSLSHLD